LANAIRDKLAHDRATSHPWTLENSAGFGDESTTVNEEDPARKQFSVVCSSVIKYVGIAITFL
jgi:hypothetical protein